MYKITIILLLVAIIGAGCEETIELDFNQTPPQYVVDGLVTNELADHYIRISTSADFYNTEATPRVSDATVTVSDDLNQVYNFEETETEPGLYTARFQGEIGRAYKLQVTLPTGGVLTATDSMYAAPAIDSLTWEVDEQEREGLPEDSTLAQGFFYNVKIYAEEPQKTTDYYLFKFYRNDTIENFNSQTGIFYSDDKLLSGYIYGLEAPAFFREGDTATIDLYRISRQAFLFYSDLDNVLNGDGGMFSPSPANPRTNIVSEKGIGFGLFQVSAVTQKSIVVGK